MTTPRFTLNPRSIFQIAEVMRGVDEAALAGAAALFESSNKTLVAKAGDLKQAYESVVLEQNRATRYKGDVPSPDPVDISHREGFLGLVYELVQAFEQAYTYQVDLLHSLEPAPLLLGAAPANLADMSLAELQTFSIQAQMNLEPIQGFVDAVAKAEAAPNQIVALARKVVAAFDIYYGTLAVRHGTGGLEIHSDPISTDLAFTLFNHTDANGEIQAGTDPDKISAYTIQKAEALLKALQSELVRDLASGPQNLLKFVGDTLTSLHEQSRWLNATATPWGKRLRSILNRVWDPPRVEDPRVFKNVAGMLTGLNPSHIVYRPQPGLLSPAERQDLRFRNKTLAGIVQRLKQGKTEEVIPYILSRKKDLRDFQLQENSFFVCQIGAGNAFTGEAAGMLRVVPGSRPLASIDEVLGSGFDQVRAFIDNVTTGAEWHDLFVATSPSKRTDKSNVLLVGPQGCGKTEVLRSVASDPNSIGIFAQASDFLTCWKGEAEKNPKRLFEAGLKIQRDSGKHVFFLIDEIDTILNDNTGQNAFGGVNLATEFQVLMDGITSYPKLAVWGATNHPERIPLPLIRRFAKVLIVGELSQEHRVALLKKFVGFMPVAPQVTPDTWEQAALKLEGAVGDVVRKVADHIWRTKMTSLVQDKPEAAREMVQFLNRDSKFEVENFTARQRHAFIVKLGKHMTVTPEDIMESVELHLNSMSIRQEISSCVESYERARRFIAGAETL